MKLCSWCKETPVNADKYDTCSRSCAGLKRWAKLKATGKVLEFHQASEKAKQTQMFKRLQKTIEKNCKELGIELTPAIRKLYIRGRNEGYHNGYTAHEHRVRREVKHA